MWNGNNMRIIISKHAKIKMADRGADEKEVIKAINEGSYEPAKAGRLLFRKNFAFNGTWRGKKYKTKQVAPVTTYENNRIIVVTVYVYYF